MPEPSGNLLIHGMYLASILLFAAGLKNLSGVRTARRGNFYSASAMLLAIVGTLLEIGWIDFRWVILGLVVGAAIGAVAALRVPMTGMPGMVALLNGAGGGASALVGLSQYLDKFAEPSWAGNQAAELPLATLAVIALAIFLGGVTVSGSIYAYLKVQEKINDKPFFLPGGQWSNLVLWLVTLGFGLLFISQAASPTAGTLLALLLLFASLGMGILLVMPIGGADMPVVIALLNSFSGLAGAMGGFVVNDYLLIVGGALVGSSGLILTRIMCVAMNRSLLNVLIGGFGATPAASGGKDEGYSNVRSCTAEEAALALEAAQSVTFVPGYGMAVAQAQRQVQELAEWLRGRGVQVKFAIHPVAGRMPGHMNVLLAEANVPYDLMIEMDDINPEFKSTDVVIVLGANDVVNPAALTNKESPIYGMPILEVHHARTVFVVKRSLGAGFAGIKNELFEAPNTIMIFGDAKKVLIDLYQQLKASA